MESHTTANDKRETDLETLDWIESLEDLLYLRGRDRTSQLLSDLQIHAQREGVSLPSTSQTPYVNSIDSGRQPTYPGDRELERRIKSIIRWNAMAMVVRANREHAGLGGHISTFASMATLYEVGFQHFSHGFHGTGADQCGLSGEVHSLSRRPGIDR